MVVTMYSPSRLYGFAEGDGKKVFFHLESFRAGTPLGEGRPLPPIVGESVVVQYDPALGSEDRAPRAALVERVDPPVLLTGVVDTFIETKGWGFIRGDNGVSYHLHRSEVEGGRLPLPGLPVQFYAGYRQGRPRACYVRILT